MSIKKNIIGLTGSSGILAKNFIKNYKKNYNFIKYPHRLEDKRKLISGGKRSNPNKKSRKSRRNLRKSRKSIRKSRRNLRKSRKSIRRYRK